MKMVAILRTSEYRGERADAVEIVFEILPDETVEQLWKRIFKTPLCRGDNKNPESDEIAIKAVYPAPTGEQEG